VAFSDKHNQIREAAESQLISFIRLIHPNTMLGGVHDELCAWWTREEAKSHQLCLLPRDHQKSRMAAYRVAWEITKHPEIRVLYISSTANLAEKQLKFIKDIFTSDIHRRYWPEMIHADEGKREKWTNSEMSVDHPKRKEENVRDSTIFTAGLTTSITGLHCDIAVCDDIVVNDNAFTSEGRNKVKSQYSLLSSIESAGALEWVVGTRYHAKDLYSDMMEMEMEVFNDTGEIIDKTPIFEKFEKTVENRGDGTGEFIWPRQRRRDGKWFGFDVQILAKKRAQYLDRMQYRAQYYNDPNDPENLNISLDKFQYYDRKFLSREQGVWFYKDKRLNIFAAIDFAYSLTKKADYTALVVVGIDSDGMIYVLDILRFKSDKVSDYYKAILNMHVKWDFRKIRAEVTAAQKVIVQEIKNNYIRPNGLALSVEEHKPNRYQGSKEERMAAILEPRYENMSMWHYQGGNCQILEEELTLARPPHDDVKDALASVVEIAIPPSGQRMRSRAKGNVIYHSRFGGVAS
jgi:hypothetical protein